MNRYSPTEKKRAHLFQKDFNQWKSEHFGPYCMTKCDRTCCDMGNVSLHVNEQELERVFGKRLSASELRELGIRTSSSKGTFSIESKILCRQFDPNTHKCLIYQQRPGSCREFPFLVEKDALVIKSGCPLSTSDAEYKKLVEITSKHGKVIVKKR